MAINIAGFDIEKFFVDSPKFPGLENVLFSRESTDYDFMASEDIFREQYKKGKKLPSAREMLAWNVACEDKYRHILKDAMKEHPEYEDSVLTFINGLLKMNGYGRTTVTRTIKMLFLENDNAYLAFGEEDDGSVIQSNYDTNTGKYGDGLDIYHDMNHPAVREFLKKAEADDRIIEEPKDGREGRNLIINYKNDEFADSKLFHALFGRDMAGIIRESDHPSKRWMIRIDLYKELFQPTQNLFGSQTGYTNLIKISNSYIAAECGPGATYCKTIENPTGFPEGLN